MHSLYFYVTSAVCSDGSIRLMVSQDSESFYASELEYDSTYYNKDGLRLGRVEVCVNGQFRTICYDSSWDEQAASVVCRQLAFSSYGEFRHTTK